MINSIRLAIAAAFLGLVSACTQVSAGQDQSSAVQPAQEFLPDGGPPVVNGFYEAQGSCPFEGCSLGDLYTTGPVVLLERPALDARVVATAPAGEWVSTENSIYRLRPARGVVVGEVHNLYENENGRPVLEIGDVVYAIDFEGEGMTRRKWRQRWYSLAVVKCRAERRRCRRVRRLVARTAARQRRTRLGARSRKPGLPRRHRRIAALRGALGRGRQ